MNRAFKIAVPNIDDCAIAQRATTGKRGVQVCPDGGVPVRFGTSFHQLAPGLANAGSGLAESGDGWRVHRHTETARALAYCSNAQGASVTVQTGTLRPLHASDNASPDRVLIDIGEGL